MKTQLLDRLSLGFALAILPLVGGCNQQTGETPQSLITPVQAEPVLTAIASANDNTATPASEPPAPPAEKTEVAIALPAEKFLPPNINPASPLAEVVKLAQAGVDESVLYAFVTNSTSIFGLGSDEIIYLNDLGVPGPLVAMIIEHDQAMKQYWANKAQAQATAAAATNTAPTETASAPSYINPPQPESASQPANVSNNYFYDTLSPYGSWVNVSGYGMCWRPTVAVINTGWQPYADRGRWVYSDCGWYWLSDYSWGATTFHYGRWFNQPNVGWCWWPDRVWGPSWVSWRYSSGYCGWAPLPPTACYRPGAGFTYYGNSVGVNFGFGLSAGCYNFVPTAYFCNPRPCNYRVPAHHANGIYNQTIVANNYLVGNNNTVINSGIPVEQVAATTRTEIRPVPVRDAGTSFYGGRGERLERGGRSLVVHRPNLPSTQDSPAGVANATAPVTTVQPVGTPRASNPGSVAINSRPAQREQFAYANRQHRSGENAAAVPWSQPRSQTGVAVLAPTAGTTTEVPSSPAPQNPANTPLTSRPDRNRTDGNSRYGQGRNPGSTSPLIIRGNDVASQPAATTPATPPSSSLVVIGNRNGAASQSRNVFVPVSSRNRQAETTARNSPSASPAPAPNQSVVAPVATAPAARQTAPGQNNYSAPQFQRRDIQQSSRSYEGRATPTASYSAPAQRQSVPVMQNYSAPAAPSAGVAQSSAPAPSARWGGSQRSNGPRDRN